MKRSHPCSLPPAPRPARLAGFGLLEALLTLVLVSAGLLGLAALQATLSREADASRQRGEATRLAQERLETLRSFQQIDHLADRAGWSRFGWNDLPDSGSDTVDEGTNTVYTRDWTLGGDQTDTFRPVRVAVSWTDRAEQPQSLALHSVIARVEPALSGSLGLMPPASTSAQPDPERNRRVSIPFQAADLGHGESAYQLQPDLTIIFSQQRGMVVKECNTSTTITSAEQAGDSSLCRRLDGYVVAGHLTLRTHAQGSEQLTPPWPTGISLAQVTGIAGAGAKCHLGKAIEQGDASAPIASHRPYLCLLPVPSAGSPWSGTIYLAGLANAGVRVCRYQFKSAEVTDNERNQQPYDNVRMSLDNQNYMIAPQQSGPCPNLIRPEDAPLAELIEHQDCTSENPVEPTQCPAS